MTKRVHWTRVVYCMVGGMMCLLSRVDLVVEGCPALHGGGG